MHGQLFLLEEEVFQVLANEKRLEILQLLRTGERNVSEMLTMLGLRQANLSQHLSLLKRTGLVIASKRGREIFYKLSDRKIIDAIDSIHTFVSSHHNIVQPQRPAFPFVVDPVCGMRLSAADAYGQSERDEITYYFCASGCMDAFIYQV